MFSSKTSSNFSFTFSSFGRYLGTWLTMRKTSAKSLFFLIAFRAFCSLLLSAIGVYNIWKANFVSCQVNEVRPFLGNYYNFQRAQLRFIYDISDQTIFHKLKFSNNYPPKITRKTIPIFSMKHIICYILYVTYIIDLFNII